MGFVFVYTCLIALYSVLCTLFSVLCSLFSVLCSLYSVLCTLFSHTIPCAIMARATLSAFAFRNPRGTNFVCASRDPLLQNPSKWNQTIPWAIIARATLRNPATLAPLT